MIIINRRIVLRPIKHSDIDTLWKWRNDHRFMTLCSIRRECIDIENFNKELSFDFHHDRHQQFLIIKRSSDIPLGTIFSYNFNSIDGNIFVTIYLSKDDEKKGYGAISFALFCQYLFEKYSLYKIYTEVYEYNEYSLKNLQNGGLAEEGRFKKHRLMGNKRYDLIRFALYRDQLVTIRRLTGLARIETN